MNMRGKTKYFIIVLLLGLAISSLVGFSSWNIHVQEVVQSPFKHVDESASINPILEEYITINGYQIDGKTEIKAPLYKTTDNKGESTGNDNNETCVTVTGNTYSVTVNDGDTSAKDSPEQATWLKDWKNEGLTFTPVYYQTGEYTASKDATGKTIWSYGAYKNKILDLPTGAPQNAGGYVCVVTASTTDDATDSAKRAAENLNIATKTVNDKPFSNCAAIIEFRILQQDTKATEPQYTYQENDDEENQSEVQSLSVRAIAPFKALRTANNGLNESTAQESTTAQSDDVMTTTTQEFTYGGHKFELSITANFATDTPILKGDDVTIKFDFPDGFNVDDEDENKEYRAIARIVNVENGEENPNYNLKNPFATYKIKKRFVKISEWKDLTGLIYKGEKQMPSLTLGGYSTEGEGSGVYEYDDVQVKAVQFDTEKNVCTDIDAWTNAGTYKVKAILYGEHSKNYEISYADGENPVKDFVIGKAPIAIPQADESTFVYNGTEQTYIPTIDVKGVKTSASEVKGCSGEKVVTVFGDKRKNAGKQTVTVTLNDTTNYKWAGTKDGDKAASENKTFAFTINKREITVTIINQESIYGNEIVDLSPVENTTYTVAKNATVTDEYSAIVSGDDASDIFTISVKDSSGKVLTSTSTVGNYTIEGTQKTEGTAANYAVTFTNGTYAINKRPITVTIINQESTYGDALKDLTATTDDAVAKNDGLENIFTLSTTATKTSLVKGSPYPITLTQTGSKTGNYTVTFTAGTYTLTARKITVHIEDKSSVYGESIASLAATTEDTVANNDGLYKIISLSVKDLDGNVLTSSSDAGAYPIEGTKKTEGVALNYDVEFVGTYGEEKQGTYTVEHATILVSCDLYSGTTYDGAAHDVLSNLVVTTKNEQTATILYKTADQTEFTDTIPTITNAGSLSFTVQITADNHNDWTTTLTVTVSKKSLTITASNQEIGKGDAPSVTADDATYSGFISGEYYKDGTIDGILYTNVLSGTLAFTFVSSTDETAVYTAEQIKNLTDDELQAANYSFKIKIEGYSAQNYVVAYVDGILTVEQEKTVAIPEGNSDFTKNKDGTYSIVYDGNNHTPLIPENKNYTINGTNSAQNAGTYTVTVSLKDGYAWAETTNDTADKTFTFIINKATVAFPFADTTTFTYNGKVQTYTPKIDGASATENSLVTVSDNTRTDAGTQNVTVALNDKTNYKWAGTADDTADKTFTFTINKRVVTISWGETTSFTYDKKPHAPTVTLGNVADNDSITVTTNITGDRLSEDGTAVNASNYTITIIGLNGNNGTNADNYQLPTDDLEKSFTITKREITVEIKDQSSPYGTQISNPLDISGKFTVSGEKIVSGDNGDKAADIFQLSTTATATSNVGTYTITGSVLDTETAKNYDVEFRGNYTKDNKKGIYNVTKLQIKFDGVIEINYNENGFSYNEDSLKEYLIVSGTSQSFNEYFNGVTPTTVFKSADATDGNGHGRSLTTTYNGKVGSTYKITATATDNYEFVSNGNIIYLKYKTVYLKGDTSTYYTIEEAVALSGSTEIVLAANKTGVVETWFTSTGYYTGAEYYTLSAKDLIVPYIDDSGSVVTASTTNNSTAGTTGVHAALCIPEGVTLTITSGKSLIITAYIAHISTAHVGAVYQHGVVLNNGTIIVDDGNSSIKAGGYLKGSGLVDLQKGTVIDVFRIYDFKGGSLTYELKDEKYFPINSYSIHNVSCKTKIYSGTNYKALYRLYVSDTWLDESYITFIGSSSAMFNLSKGYVLKSASNAAKNSSSNALTTIAGSNQIMGQKDEIEVHGTVKDASITLSVKLSFVGSLGVSASIKTSTDSPLPISYMNIIVGSEGYLTLSAASYKFMPGTSLQIKDGGKLETGSKTQLVFYTEAQCSTEEQFSSYGYNYYTQYCVDKSSTELGTYDSYVLVKNGTLNSQGRISGKILCGSENANMTLAQADAQITVLVSALASGLSGSHSARKSVLMRANGPVMISNNAYTTRNFAAGTYRSKLVNGSYAWYSETANIYYETNGGVAIDPATNKSVGENGYTITQSDLPTPTKTYYTFEGWFMDDKLTAEAEVGTTIFASCNLYSKWTPITYTIDYIFVYEDCTLPEGLTPTNGNAASYIYGDFTGLNSASLVDSNGEKALTWYSWFSDENCENRTNQIGTANFDKFTKYQDESGTWHVKVYGKFLSKNVSVYTVKYETNLTDESDNDVELSDEFLKSTDVFTPNDSFNTQYNADANQQKYFIGWYTRTNEENYTIFTGGDIFKNYEIFCDSTATLTLYGKWAEKAQLVIEIPAVGDNEAVTIETGKYYYEDQSTTLPDITEYSELYTIPDGYKFVGFKATKGCTSTIAPVIDQTTGSISEIKTNLTIGNTSDGLTVTADIRKVVKVDITMAQTATYTHNFGGLIGEEKKSNNFSIDAITLAVDTFFSYDDTNWSQSTDDLDKTQTTIYLLQDTSITITIPSITITVSTWRGSKEHTFTIDSPTGSGSYTPISKTDTTFTFNIKENTAITWTKSQTYSD